VLCEPSHRQDADAALLGSTDGQRWRPVPPRRASLHLDEDDFPVVRHHDVEFTDVASPVLIEHSVPVLLIPSGSLLLTPSPAGLSG
jgi:hypothetical protein